MTSFSTLFFGVGGGVEFYTSYKKTEDMFGIPRKSRASKMYYLCKNILIWKVNLFRPDVDLKSVKSRVWWDHTIK